MWCMKTSKHDFFVFLICDYIDMMGLMPILLFLLQKIPYIGPITGGVKAGMSFFLQGVVASNASR